MKSATKQLIVLMVETQSEMSNAQTGLQEMETVAEQIGTRIAEIVKLCDSRFIVE